jgi:hypothetical protein
VPGRISAIVLLVLGAAACTHDGPEDPAIATPGGGIPMGAVGAVGVSFDPMPVTRVEPSPARRKKPRLSQPVPDTMPPDPFADPSDPPGTAHPHAPPPAKKHQGTSL